MTDITAKLAEAAQTLVDAYREKYKRAATGGLRKDAPLTKEVAELNARVIAYRHHTEAQAGRMELGREAFEAFHARRKSKGAAYREALFARRPDDTYADDSVQRHWWTWQNARATPAAAPAAAQGDVREQFASKYGVRPGIDRAVHFRHRWDDRFDAFIHGHEAGRQQGMEQERALWQMAKDAQESGMYDDALCAPAKPCGNCNCLAQCGDTAAWAAEQAGPVALARRFHEAYERLAPQFGYETRADTKAFDPTSPNGRLMTAVCAEVAAPPAMERRPLTYEAVEHILKSCCMNRPGEDIAHVFARALERAHGITAGTTEQAKEQK
jgi:hypothetical protein